jgi:hypothetical protein
MDFGGAESYRFFFRVGTDSEYELPPLLADFWNELSVGGNAGRPDADSGWERLGGWRGVAGASG